MTKLVHIPNVGDITRASGFKLLTRTSNGAFSVGQNGVHAIAATGDGKVEFICFEKKSLALVNSSLGYLAYYPVHAVQMQKPLKAVLMDLDGTSVRSEEFWIWIIEKTTASLLDDPRFQLQESDIPFVSGHSVSEHLTHCINKYCPDKTVEAARDLYFRHTHFELDEIVQGRGRPDAFTPSEGLAEFLSTLKERGIKIGLVTSGLYEKAWPEILNAFETLGLGDPRDFYDAIITAGFPLRQGSPGTLGELAPKPHPWLYAETARVGLGIEFADRNSVVGIEDSGAGVCSIRLAGFPTIGVGGGNIIASGTRELCCHYCKNLNEVAKTIL
jgi:beta-phosphoglucomutase-like phosphatase (HAD superfamily)